MGGHIIPPCPTGVEEPVAFPGDQACVWYASDIDCLRANLRSVLWGVAAKEYPVHRWMGALRSFHLKANLKRVAAFKQLRSWAVQGKHWRVSRPSEHGVGMSLVGLA